MARKWFNHFNQMIRRSLRFRLFLLILLSIFPATVFLIYSIITKQHHEVLAVVIVAISVGIVILFSGNILNLKSLSSLIELSKRLSSGDLTARSSQTDSLGVFGELAQSLDRIAASLEAGTEKLQHQTDKAEVLAEIVNELTVQHNIATLLQLIVDKVKMLLNGSFSVISLYDVSRSDLEVAAVSGLEVPTKKRIRMGEGASGRAAETRQPFMIDRYEMSAHLLLAS